MSDLPNSGPNRPPLFDFSASRHARARAKRLDGDRFLYRAAAEGVADRLHLPEGTVKSLLFRARRQLAASAAALDMRPGAQQGVANGE